MKKNVDTQHFLLVAFYPQVHARVSGLLYTLSKSIPATTPPRSVTSTRAACKVRKTRRLRTRAAFAPPDQTMEGGAAAAAAEARYTTEDAIEAIGFGPTQVFLVSVSSMAFIGKWRPPFLSSFLLPFALTDNGLSSNTPAPPPLPSLHDSISLHAS